MSIRLSDILFYGGGECFQRFGTPIWRSHPNQSGFGTFTRTGDATRRTKGGQVVTASANRLRVDHELVNGVWRPTCLVQAAATNRMLQSEDFGTTWLTTGTTSLTTNNAVAPDGETTADTIGDNDAAAAAAFYQSVAISDDSEPFVASVFVEKAGSAVPIGMLTLTAGGGSLPLTHSVQFDPFTGGMFPGAGANEPDDWGVIDEGDYWRFWIRTDNNSSGHSTSQLQVYPARHATLGGALDVTQTGTINAWGVQHEDGAFPSSYLATTTVGVTRNAETWYSPFPHLQQPFTAYVKMREAGSAFISPVGGIFHIGGSSSVGDPRFGIHSTGGLPGQYTTLFDNGDAQVTATVAGGDAVTSGDLVELLVHFDANEDGDGDLAISQSIDEGASTTPVTASGPTGGLTADREWNDSRIYPGSRGTSNHGLNLIYAIKLAKGGSRTFDEMRNVFPWVAE